MSHFLVHAPIAPKNMLCEIIKSAGAPVLYILQLTSVRLYLSRGAHLLIGACAKKRDNTVLSINMNVHVIDLQYYSI